MKFLADENFPKPLVKKLQNLGFSVKTVQQKSLQGSSDQVVANLAQTEERVILTFDKNFLKGQLLQVPLVIFDFPRVPTQEIVIKIEAFISTLQKQDLSKQKVLKFSKSGLEEFQRI